MCIRDRSRSVYGQSVTSAVKDYSAIEPAAKAPKTSTAYEPAQVVTGTQQTLGDYDKVFLTESSKKQFSIIGQLFKTYWLIEFEDKLYIIDQHAAHEKVLYEKTMARLANKDFTSQRISPPIVKMCIRDRLSTISVVLSTRVFSSRLHCFRETLRMI